MFRKVMSRLNFNCDSHVELAYYRSALGQVDISLFVVDKCKADTNAEKKPSIKLYHRDAKHVKENKGCHLSSAPIKNPNLSLLMKSSSY